MKTRHKLKKKVNLEKKVYRMYKYGGKYGGGNYECWI